MFCLAGVYVVLRVPGLEAGVFAEERGNQTLGLLFLSGLGAAEVFASKALSAALVAWTDLMALFPMLALPFLIGGVSFDLFLATILALPALLLFVLAVTLLASVLTEEEGAAVVLTFVLGVMACGLPPAVGALLQHFFPQSPPSRLWLRLSPAYGPWLIWTGRAVRGDVWVNLMVTLAWSGLCLGGAAAALKRLWREQADGGQRARWRERWRGLVHGRASHRRALAAKWLDVNPFVWLTTRDSQLTFTAWAVVGGICGAWLLGWGVWGSRWVSALTLLLTVTLLNASLQWLYLYAAAKGLATARKDGSFELLLTTPLWTSDIVWGELQGLSRRFRPVARCVFALDAALLIGGLAFFPWKPSTLFVYGVVTSLLLFWIWPLAQSWRPVREVIPGVFQTSTQPSEGRRALFVMWASLNTGRPVFAVWKTSPVSPWIWFLNLYNIYMFGFRFSMFATFPSGSSVEVMWASFAAVVLALAWLGRLGGGSKADPLGSRLVREFREIVCEPLPDRDDPGFKQWNPRERFPRLGDYIPKPHWLLRRVW